MRLPVSSPRILRLTLLLSATVLVWLLATGRWQLSAWKIPAAYSVDALEMLARLKISGEKGLSFFFDKSMSQLGAPWSADWSAYPMPDAPVFILFGQIASVIGLIPASNLALLFAHLTAVAAFYVCSRALGHRAIFAAGGALLFGFSFYNFHRGLSHYSFALTYVVPAQLLTAWLIGGSRQLLARTGWRWFCLGTAVATGFGNPYFGFAFCQLLALALVFQAATVRHRRNLRLGFACLAVFAVTLVLANYSAVRALLHGNAGLLQRNYAATEIYGLRPIELLIPSPFHRWPFAAEIGRHYAAATSLHGELFFPYLGVAGLAGLFAIAALLIGRMRRGHSALRPAYALAFLWLTGFFIVGGVNSLLAFTSLDLFRAGNRYSIYLLALALLALVSWASRRLRRLGATAAAALTLPFVLLGLWDQIPVTKSRGEVSALAQKISSDQQLARLLDTTLPPGAAVFQLPVTTFLEQPPVNGMSDYELFRPFLYSSRAHYAYGLLAEDKGLRWQKWIATHPVATLCAELETAGFAALYIHKAAFTDAAAGLRQQLTARGKKIIFDSGDHLVFALESSAKPQWPNLDDARLADPWNPSTVADDSVLLFAADGWFPLERSSADSWRWAETGATLSLWNGTGAPMAVMLEFSTATLRSAPLTATLAGRNIWQLPAGQTTPTPAMFAVTLQPGDNRLAFHFAGQPIRPAAGDPRRLGFQLRNLRVTPVTSR